MFSAGFLKILLAAGLVLVTLGVAGLVVLVARDIRRKELW